jgi:peptide/nickel transport system substrate-binding protein
MTMGRRLLLLLAGLALAGLVGAACGGDEKAEPTKAPAATAAPTKAPEPTPTQAAQPTATSTAAPTQAPAAPTPIKQSGTLNLAIRQINPGVWLQRNGHASELTYQLSISEGFFMPGGSDNADDVGMLVESWSLAPDLGKVTLKIRRGVQFHDNWGEMTAEDVVYSVNQSNGAVTANSIQAQAGDLANLFGAWQQVDRYTVDAPFIHFDSTWQRGLLNIWYQSVDVLSKKVFDDLGEQKANETAVATGPFKLKAWIAHDRIEALALSSHWRATPKITGYVVREMPEETARIAALKTGEIQITEVRVLRSIPDVQAAGLTVTKATLESQHDAIIFGGNLWEKTHAQTGAVLDRKGFLPDDDHPWIGDPDNPARMESARKVRWAMALAIDREAINKTILGGLGTVNPLPWFSKNNKELWEDRWDVPYDPAKAKQLLSEAGYPNGFKTKVRLYDTQIYGPQEISKAVAGMWRDTLGLQVEVDLSNYSSFRPSIVDRSVNIPWMSGCDEGRNLPADWPRGSKGSSLLRGGFGCNEIPTYAQLYLKSSQEPDRIKRIQINKQVGDYAHEWMIQAGTVEVPGIWAYDPKKVQTWGLRRGFKNTLNSLETVVLK